MATYLITALVTTDDVPEGWPHHAETKDGDAAMQHALFEAMKSQGLAMPTVEIKPIEEKPRVILDRIMRKWSARESISAVAAASNERIA